MPSRRFHHGLAGCATAAIITSPCSKPQRRQYFVNSSYAFLTRIPPSRGSTYLSRPSCHTGNFIVYSFGIKPLAATIVQCWPQEIVVECRFGELVAMHYAGFAKHPVHYVEHRIERAVIYPVVHLAFHLFGYQPVGIGSVLFVGIPKHAHRFGIVLKIVAFAHQQQFAVLTRLCSYSMVSRYNKRTQLPLFSYLLG